MTKYIVQRTNKQDYLKIVGNVHIFTDFEERAEKFCTMTAAILAALDAGLNQPDYDVVVITEPDPEVQHQTFSRFYHLDKV